MCKCKELNDCEEALPTRDDFIKEFRKLDSSSELWAELFACDSCRQRWIVEERAEADHQSNKAFKIDDSVNWLKHDTRPALAEWLISEHGGLCEQQCTFTGCEAKALKNMAVCVQHGHPIYKWGSTT